MTFSVHMTVGILLVLVQTYFQFKHKFRNINDLRFTEPQNIQELRQQITVWQRAAASLSSYSKDEDLVRETLLKKVNKLGKILKKRLATGSVPVESYQATLEELQAKVHTSKIHMFFIINFNVLFFSTQFEIKHF